MSNLSKKEITIIFTPFIAGAWFVITVFLNHALFDNQIITARQAVGYEWLIFLIGFIAIIVQLPFTIRWLFKKQWKPAFFCVVSATTFWASIMFGASQGAAIFYAT